MFIIYSNTATTAMMIPIVKVHLDIVFFFNQIVYNVNIMKQKIMFVIPHSMITVF